MTPAAKPVFPPPAPSAYRPWISRPSGANGPTGINSYWANPPAMGHLDLALWLIRKASPDLAALVSRYLLADIRSAQAPSIIPNDLAKADPLIARFERWSRARLKHGFSLQDAASAWATSARSLQRRRQAALGKSPLAYFQDLPVERAHALLHGSGLDLDAIATDVGYVDGATLRTLLRQRLGRGVRDLRADLR